MTLPASSSRAARPRRRPLAPLAGFTLIELLVVVAIVAILAAVAVPIYEHEIQESRRTDAKTALLDLAGREERYFSLNNAYSETASDLGYSAWPQTVGSGYYQLSQPTVTAGSTTAAPGFVAVATPIAGTTQASDSACQYFSVDNTGKEISTNNSGGGGTDTTSTCWQ